ncbi:MAG: GNAT family N-acetyltransferase [Wenzhouxiangellaceae bacterium]
MNRQHGSDATSQHAGVSPASLEWRLHAFERLELAQLYAVLAARVAVFVVEQDCPYQDLDGLDEVGMHLVAWQEAASVAAYARILPPGTRFEQPSIGRVLTDSGLRRTGLGRELMRRAVVETRRLFPDQAIRLSAQCYLERFYQALGFSIVSRPYEEDGIPHVEMELPATGSSSN